MKRILGFSAVAAVLAAGVALANLTITPPPVTPPAVQPPAINVTNAQMVTALQSAGYVVTAPGSSSSSSGGGSGSSSSSGGGSSSSSGGSSGGTGGIVFSTPAAGSGLTGSGTGAWNGTIIDKNGQLDPYYGGTPVPSTQLAGAPGGNWNNNVSISYGVTDPAGSTQTCALLTPGGNWPQALLHAIGVKGNPMGNGIASNLAGFNYFQVDVYPYSAGLQLSMQLFTVMGVGSYVGPNTSVIDQGYPQGATSIASGTSLPAGKWTRIKGPLSLLHWPLTGGTAAQETASTWTYKNSLQENSPQAGMKVCARSWGYSIN